MTTLKHVYSNPQPDDGDPNVTGPDEWNSDHVSDHEFVIMGAAPSGLTGTRSLAVSGLASLTDGGAGSSATIGVASAAVVAAVQAAGVALTKTDDTNVTLTLGGSPTVALLAATSLTLGWTGLLGLARGGTHADLSATGGTGQYLKQAGVGADVTVGTIPASDIASGTALTKTDDTNVTLTLGGTPASALLKATSLTLGWTGLLGLARGGTHADLSATGGIGQYLKQSSVGADITVGTIAAADLPGTFSGFANPTASVGLSAVNGSATTAMRSDAAPALSQAIAPTWTSLHIWSRADANDFVQFWRPDIGRIWSFRILDTSQHFVIHDNAGFDSLTVGHDGNITAYTGFLTRLGAHPAGNVLRSDGTSFIDATLTAADIGSGAALTRTNDTNVTLTLGGTPTTALLAATSLTLGWTGLLGLARGGTHTDLSATGGTGQYLKQAGAGSDITVGTIAAADLPANGANPSASVGLSAVNGSATTWMRSDGAPPLSQSITPTWTNPHTWSTNGLGAVFTAYITISNTTAATSGATLQLPGVISLAGTVWNTSGTPASNTMTTTIGLVGTSGAAPSSRIAFRFDINGGGFTEKGSVTSAGMVSATTGFLINLSAPTAGHYLRGNGTAFVDGTISVNDLPNNGANPTASLGLTAVNGSATTWMRSDGAPALSQSIVPSWTGLHKFSAQIWMQNGTSNTIFFDTIGVAVPANGSAGQKIQLYGAAGTVAIADYALGIESNYMWFTSNGGYKWYNGAASVKMQLETGTAGLIVAGYLNVAGAIAAPTNTTAGDFQAVRSFITSKLQVGGTGVPTHTFEVTGSADIRTGVFTTFINSQSTPSAPDGGGLAVIWNFSGGSGEVDFFNCYSTGGFYFYQRTGASTQTLLATLDASGIFTATSTITAPQFSATSGTSVFSHATGFYNIELAGTGTGAITYGFYIDTSSSLHLDAVGVAQIAIWASNGDYQILGSNAYKASGTAWINPSDARIKNVFGNFEDGLDVVERFQPKRWIYNEYAPKSIRGEEGLGFVAQDVEDVAEYMVKTRPGQLGSEDVEDFRYFDSHALSFILVNAVKELSEQNQALLARLDALERRN